MIFNILSKIGFSGFTEYINVYEENMEYISTSNSPLDQYFIDQVLFQDQNCYDVLRATLNKFDAIIRQKDGGFIIYDPTDLYQATIYGRIFTTGSSHSSTSKTPEYFLDRTTQASDIRDIEGGNLGVKNGSRLITLNQDYGYKDSWIFNYKLLRKTYDEAAGVYQGWQKGSGWSNVTYAGENEGVTLFPVLSSPPNDPLMYQSFGMFAVASSDVFVFSFEYKFINWSGSAQSVTVLLRIKYDSGNHWLYVVDDTEAAWNGSADDYEFTETAEVGKSGWNTFSRQINGIPHSGSYTITLYGIHSAAGVGCLVQNFRFYCTSDELTIKRFKKPTWWQNVWSLGQEKRDWKKRKPIVTFVDNEEVVLNVITRTNDNDGINQDFQQLLGDVTDANVDNILEQLAGALSYREITGYINSVDKQVRITKNSTDEDAYISANRYSHLMAWNTDPITTITAFIASNPDFGGLSFIDNFDGSFDLYDNSDFPIPEEGCIDEDLGTTVDIAEYYIGDPVYTHYPTSVWNSRTPGGESKELLKILADKLQLQYSRSRQILSIPIMEKNTSNNFPKVDIMGCFKDVLNQYDSESRTFVFNRGTFDVRNREWNIDFIEIIPIPEPE